MTDHIVAVVGATGRTGRPFVQALLERGAAVRAISRRAYRPDVLDARVDLRTADLLNVDSLVAAFCGATAIHYIPPSYDPADLDYARNIIAAAMQADIARIVYHSVLHPATPEMPHHLRKTRTEREFRHSPLTWTILQPAMYAQTALAFFDARTAELMPAFDTRRAFTPIHEADLAQAAAIVHTTGNHAFATYELAGAETLDFVAMGERLGGILGRTVTTRRVASETLAPFVAAARGYTPEQVRELCLMFDHYDRHGLVGNGNVLRMILGREPTTFAEAMRASLSA